MATGVYALASAAQRGLSFFLLPVYTRHLTLHQYGALELLGALGAVLNALLLLGLPGALTKCFHRDCETEAEQRAAWSTALLIATPVSLLGATAVFAAAPSISSWLGLEGSPWPVRLVALNGIAPNLLAVSLSLFRAQERPAAFATLSLLQAALAGVLNVVFLIPLGMGLEGVLLGNLLSNLAVLPIAIAWAQRGRPSLSRRMVRPLLAFGLLTLPSSLSVWIVDLSDRWVLQLFDGLEDVAVYGVGYKVALALQLLLVWPFQLSWPNVAFSIRDDEERARTMKATLVYLTLGLSAGAVALSAAAPVVLPWLAGGAYREAYRVVPLVTCGYLLNGVFFAVSPALHVAERTRVFPALTMGAAATNLVLNFALIPPLGAIGAATATTLSFGQLALTAAWLGGDALGLRWPWLRLGKIAASTLGALAMVYVCAAEDFGALLGLALPPATLVVLLLATRFAEPGEVVVALGRVRAVLRGAGGRRGPGDP